MNQTPIGQILLTLNYLTRDKLQMALTAQNLFRMTQRSHFKIGEILLLQKSVDLNQLREGLKAQIAETRTLEAKAYIPRKSGTRNL